MENAYDLEKKYLTQKEVADRFRVTPSTIKNWRDEGKLVYIFQTTEGMEDITHG